VKLTGVELRYLVMPLVSRCRTSFGSRSERHVLLVRLVTPEGEGWGECVAGTGPHYSEEYVDGARHVIVQHILPALFRQSDVTAGEVASLLAGVRGHRMAKAAVEMAVLDAELRASEVSLGAHLGAVRPKVAAGVSVGIFDSIPDLLDTVGAHLGEGYRRVKLKIEPGWDVEPVAAVRREFGPEAMLQVDANGAYRLADADHLAQLDDFGLALLEQPLAPDCLGDHAALARRLATPVCLDESVVSAAVAADAIAMGACSVVNIKPGRVGGYLEARRVHDVCAAAAVPVWCGGSMETGLGRAANVALAGLPNFTLPGDTSASARYYARDLTQPFVLDDGCLAVPTGPGLGVDVDLDALAHYTRETEHWVP